jgi:nitrate reductase gamma subunit
MEPAGTLPAAPLALAFAAALAVFVFGLAWRIAVYARTPVPLKIPTTPAPRTRAGVVLRMAREVVFFESLFRANLWTWALGWAFHASLVVVLVRHLRYFTHPVWEWVAWMQPVGILAGLVMPAALAGLWARRLFVPRIRFISTPSDHLMLVLLLAIAASGLATTFLAHTDIVAVKRFALGLLRAEANPLPADALVLGHLALVALLALIFPFSKLLHAPGLFFSPTRNQTDDSREHRHMGAGA